MATNVPNIVQTEVAGVVDGGMVIPIQNQEQGNCNYLNLILWIAVGILAAYWIQKMFMKPRYRYNTNLEQQTEAKTLTKEQVEALFNANAGKKCLFLFAEWCGHCQACKKDFDMLAASEEDVEVVKFNGGEDSSQETLQMLFDKGYKIQGFPFFLCLENGEEKAQQTGAFPRGADSSMLAGMQEFVEKAFA